MDHGESSQLPQVDVEEAFRVTEKNIKDCEALFKKCGIKENKGIGERIRKNLDQANQVLDNVTGYVFHGNLPTLVPTGPTNSGKSFFVNSLALCDNLSELETSTLSQDESDRWWSSYPVTSSTLGQGPATVLCTAIIPSENFVVSLQISGRAMFDRRQMLYKKFQENLDENVQSEAPTFEELSRRLVSMLNRLVIRNEPIVDDVPESIDLIQAFAPALNIFDGLAQSRRNIRVLEEEVRLDPFLSWLVSVRILGPFHHLTKLRVQLADV